MSKSILQKEKQCYECHSPYVEEHHIYNGGFRKSSDKWGCTCYLCPTHHRDYVNGVHGKNKKLLLRIQQDCQRKFEELYGHEKFMDVFRHNYL